MIPELSSGHTHPLRQAHGEGGQWVGLVLQFLGMLLGVAIMLVIALSEHFMEDMFSQHH